MSFNVENLIPVIVSQPLAAAIINADDTGTELTDIESIKTFSLNLIEDIGNAVFMTGADSFESFWGRCEITELDGDCVTLYVHPSDE